MRKLLAAGRVYDSQGNHLWLNCRGFSHELWDARDSRPQVGT
jgi:hypothetical protein